MSQVNTNAIYDASGGSTAKLYGVSMRDGGTGWVNRIINGAMVIDQRNAGASVTYSSNPGYPVDRNRFEFSQVSKITGQRSTTAPAGFSNSAQGTVAAAVTPGASDYFLIGQAIEGLNVADLGWGTASAQTVTLSFWVRSSVTGTYSLRFINGSFNRTYLTSYTISAANTWEYKTITLVGDTSGTWATDNTAGIVVQWDLGAGSNATSSTTNAWQAGNYQHVTGSVNWISTAGATFYITGVQLEAGSTATSFDRRDYGRELIMCQRYYEALSANASGALGAGQFIALGVSETTTRVQPYYAFRVQKRVSPSTTLSTISSFGIRSTGSSVACSSGAFGSYSTAYAQGEFNNGGGGLVAGGCAWLTNHTGAATIEWSAEL